MAATAVALPGSSGLLGVFGTANGGALNGFSVRETAAAVASFRLREGSATGKIIATVALVASASIHEWFGPQGVYVNADIYYEKVAGTIEGAVWTA